MFFHFELIFALCSSMKATEKWEHSINIRWARRALTKLEPFPWLVGFPGFRFSSVN
jgi:hypothetical protein